MCIGVHRSEDADQLVACPQAKCGASVRGRELAAHLACKHHIGTPPPPTCPDADCGKTFRNRIELRAHMKEDHADRKFGVLLGRSGRAVRDTPGLQICGGDPPLDEAVLVAARRDAWERFLRARSLDVTGQDCVLTVAPNGTKCGVTITVAGRVIGMRASVLAYMSRFGFTTSSVVSAGGVLMDTSHTCHKVHAAILLVFACMHADGSDRVADDVRATAMSGRRICGCQSQPQLLLGVGRVGM